MDHHLKLKAIEGAYLALDAIKKHEERRKRASTELHKLSGFIDSEHQLIVIEQLRELHETGMPLAAAQQTVLGVEAKLAAFRKKIQRASSGGQRKLLSRVDRDHPELDTAPFARTREAPAATEDEAHTGALDKLVPGGPDSDFPVRRPTARL